MTPKELLETAWKLIEDPSKRCIKVFARDVRGHSVLPTSKSAVCFCSIGALYAKYRNNSECYTATKYLRQAAMDVFEVEDIVFINDSDVINNPPKLYARAIEIASEHENNKL